MKFNEVAVLTLHRWVRYFKPEPYFLIGSRCMVLIVQPPLHLSADWITSDNNQVVAIVDARNRDWPEIPNVTTIGEPV